MATKTKSQTRLTLSWWMIGFVAFGTLFYLYAMGQKDQTYNEMSGRLRLLEKEKEMVLAQRQELLLQIKSQSDPAWVEMVLKRNLGLVPERQVKVYFHNK